MDDLAVFSRALTDAEHAETGDDRRADARGERGRQRSLVQHGDEEVYNSRWRQSAAGGDDLAGTAVVDDYGVNRVTTAGYQYDALGRTTKVPAVDTGNPAWTVGAALLLLVLLVYAWLRSVRGYTAPIE